MIAHSSSHDRLQSRAPFPAVFVAAALSLAMAGCASGISSKPLNKPLIAHPLMPAEAISAQDERPDVLDNNVIMLAFSGGGTRAAAFAYGVLRGLEELVPAGDKESKNGLDYVRLLSGVSGGSVAAAYYGLKGKSGYRDFRQRFLVKDVESALRTDVSIANVTRMFEGGVNDDDGLPKWLNENLYNGATFADMMKPGRPLVYINASDFINRTQFHFSPETFATFCSNLADYPVAHAVAASAAVPLIFAPVVIKTYSRSCANGIPEWIARAEQNAPELSGRLQTLSKAMRNYSTPGKMDYIKLLDGGLTDNIGILGLTLYLTGSEKPYEPFKPREVVRLDQMAVILVNSGVQAQVVGADKVTGPSGVDLMMAVTDTMMDSSSQGIIDDLRRALDAWKSRLIPLPMWIDGKRGPQDARLDQGMELQEF